MLVSGFTFVRNGIRYGYPLLESLRSLLPIVDELVVNVGISDDGTLEAVRSLHDPKIKIFTTQWDDDSTEMRDRIIFSRQTNLALDRIRGDWGIYLQADEVIHERDYDRILKTLKHDLDRPWVEGYQFDYIHFEADCFTINPWRYRREIRIVRNKPDIRSFEDAFTFRKADGCRLLTRNLHIPMFHYGWTRTKQDMMEKIRYFESFYRHGAEYEAFMNTFSNQLEYDFPDYSICKPYTGTHPMVMRERLTPRVQPQRSRWLQPRFYSKSFREWKRRIAGDRLLRAVKTGWLKLLYRSGIKTIRP